MAARTQISQSPCRHLHHPGVAWDGNFTVVFVLQSEIIGAIRQKTENEVVSKPMFINSKLEENNSLITLNSNDYCLVNSKWMNNVKYFYKYELIRKALNSNKEIKSIIDNNKDKHYFNLKELNKIYEIIKKIPYNTLDELNLKIQNKEFKSEINFYPDFIPIKNRLI